MPDWTLLDSFFSFAPADLNGSVIPNLGSAPNVINADAFKAFLDVIANDGTGINTIDQIITSFGDLKTKFPQDDQGNDISTYFTIHSSKSTAALGKTSKDGASYLDKTGAPQQISSLQEVLGADFTVTPDMPSLGVFLSHSPYINPATCNAKRCEIFLNSMPPMVVSQLVPFLQIEFMVSRNYAKQLQAPGLLKFLLGAPDKSGVGGPNKALIAGHEIPADPSADKKTSPELDFAGMEMFTTPQTLFNPTPNADGSNRYTDVIDPTRPFASIQQLTIKAVPSGAGFYTYKTAQLQLKIHDRSRLAEISDFIRPRAYTGGTIWLTYGWRAPVLNTDQTSKVQTYFDYINNNMLIREAYHIKNSSFSFDATGQVTLTLELWTRGVDEMRQSKISDVRGSLQESFDTLKRLSERISELRQQLHLDPPQGLNRDVRAFIILDAASVGGLPPNMTKKDIQKGLDDLRGMQGNANINQSALSELIADSKSYYDAFNDIDPKSSKFALPSWLDGQVTTTINNMFKECYTGADPYLPQAETWKAAQTIPDDLGQAIQAYNNYKTQAKSDSTQFQKGLCSFGKLFSVFALRNLASQDMVDEVQVFFYSLNDQCGPVSGLSVAEFPIMLEMFKDQYREHVIKNGGERLSLEEFLSLIISGQFLDNRSVGYGMQSFYEPYNTKNPALKTTDAEGKDATQLAAWQKKYGTFKQPTIEFHVEVSHARGSTGPRGQTDILTQLNYSTKISTDGTTQGLSTAGSADSIVAKAKRIMRVHIYDKQVNPYKKSSTLLRTDNDTGFYEIPHTSYAKQFQPKVSVDPSTQTVVVISEQGKEEKPSLQKIGSNSQIKDMIAQQMPTIRFGANGTTVLTANLNSKADSLVSSEQMRRTMTVRNTVAPNGSGEGGIPLRVLPAQLAMTSLGIPLARMAQKYFVDFQTGTTLDALYIVTGLTHTFSPGKFETQWQMAYADGYATWTGAQSISQFAQNQQPVTVPSSTT